MAKTLIVLLLLVFISASMVSATAIIGEPYNVTVGCSTFTCANLNITILNPNSSTFVENASMTNHILFATYQLYPDTFGEYSYYLYDGSNFGNGTFSATSTGYQTTTSSAILYLIMFAVIFFTFATTLKGLDLLPNSNARDQEGRLIQVSYLKYLRPILWFFLWILFIGTLFLSSNLAFAYLGEQLFAQTIFAIFKIAIGVTPLIIFIWFIFLIQQVKEDKQLSASMRRGLYPQGGRF